MSEQLPQPRRMQQLRLWPSDDEDALIYQTSALYRRLDDTGQKIVRGYLMALEKQGDWPSKRSVAEMSGLSKSTVSERLQKGSEEMAAITEVLSSCRDDLARRSSVAIPALAALITAQFFPPKDSGRLPRDTRTLTPVELKVLHLASAMGGVAIGLDGQPASLVVATQHNQDGSTTTAAQIQMPSAGPSLQDILIKLRPDATRPSEAETSHETPESVQSQEVPASEGVEGQPSGA